VRIGAGERFEGEKVFDKENAFPLSPLDLSVVSMIKFLHGAYGHEGLFLSK
jgi:hypothetical protein